MSSTVPERMRSGFPIIPKSDRLIPYPSIFKNKPMPKTTPFQPPTHLMSFSYNSDKAQVFDDSAMRYFVDPPIGSNLKYGYERWKWEPDERGRIDSLLKAISMVKMDSKMSGESFSGMDVVSWRGIMTKYAPTFTLVVLIYSGWSGLWSPHMKSSMSGNWMSWRWMVLYTSRSISERRTLQQRTFFLFISLFVSVIGPTFNWLDRHQSQYD